MRKNVPNHHTFPHVSGHGLLWLGSEAFWSHALGIVHAVRRLSRALWQCIARLWFHKRQRLQRLRATYARSRTLCRQPMLGSDPARNVPLHRCWLDVALDGFTFGSALSHSHLLIGWFPKHLQASPEPLQSVQKLVPRPHPNRALWRRPTIAVHAWLVLGSQRSIGNLRTDERRWSTWRHQLPGSLYALATTLPLDWQCHVHTPWRNSAAAHGPRGTVRDLIQSDSRFCLDTSLRHGNM